MAQPKPLLGFNRCKGAGGKAWGFARVEDERGPCLRTSQRSYRRFWDLKPAKSFSFQTLLRLKVLSSIPSVLPG